MFSDPLTTISLLLSLRPGKVAEPDMQFPLDPTPYAHIAERVICGHQDLNARSWSQHVEPEFFPLLFLLLLSGHFQKRKVLEIRGKTTSDHTFLLSTMSVYLHLKLQWDAWVA